MTALKPLGTIRGVDLFGDARGGIEAHRDGVFIGNAFPQNVRQPDGRWYGKRRGVNAVLFDGKDQAITYVVGPVRVRVLGDLYHGRIPEGAVYVGRAAPGLPASPYANPHKVGKSCRLCDVEHDRAGAVEAYRRDLAEHPELVAAARRDLTGRDLACWCQEFVPCHGDVLVEISNAPC